MGAEVITEAFFRAIVAGIKYELCFTVFCQKKTSFKQQYTCNKQTIEKLSTNRSIADCQLKVYVHTRARKEISSLIIRCVGKLYIQLTLAMQVIESVVLLH